jgi:alanine-synthesizing transaminase
MGTRSGRIPSSLLPNRLAETRARVGEVALDLTVSNPTVCGLPYPERLLEALSHPRGLSYRPEPRGPRPAQEAVAAWYRRWDVDVDPASVVLTASTSEAYSLLFKLLCDPGDVVIAPTPSYPLFDQLARLDAVRLHPLPLEEDDDWRLRLDAVTAAPPTARAVIVVHPNNPTGSFVHPEDAEALVAACRDNALALIADEVFLPFPLDGGPGAGTSFAAVRGCLTFTLGGISKCLGLPQLKLAWIVVGGPDEAVRAALESLDYVADAYLSTSTPIALAAPELLDAAAPVGSAIGERCRRNLATLREAVSSLPAVTVPAIGGGWSVPIRLPAVIDEEELALRLLEDHGVAVHPGYLFDLPRSPALVLSLLTPENRWRAGIDALLATIRAML